MLADDTVPPTVLSRLRQGMGLDPPSSAYQQLAMDEAEVIDQGDQSLGLELGLGGMGGLSSVGRRGSAGADTLSGNYSENGDDGCV